MYVSIKNYLSLEKIRESSKVKLQQNVLELDNYAVDAFSILCGLLLGSHLLLEIANQVKICENVSLIHGDNHIDMAVYCLSTSPHIAKFLMKILAIS